MRTFHLLTVLSASLGLLLIACESPNSGSDHQTQSRSSYASHGHNHKHHGHSHGMHLDKPAKKSKPGEKLCPVTGDPIGDNPYTAEYRGKTYEFCCKGCVKDFLADPQTYLPAS